MNRRRRWIIALGLPLLGAGLGWYLLPWCVSLPPGLEIPRTASVRYLARDGAPLRQLLTAEGDRVSEEVTFAELPNFLIQATLAAEDRRFFSHGGVDLLAVARAFRDNAKTGRVVSGASTIHQQLVKVASGRMTGRTLGVKFQEALQARRLAMAWSREEVLTAYLNRIHYGNLLTGCASAASGYFNKPLRDLTVAESAFLAALPQSPSRFNPFRDRDAVRPRQERILKAMNELGHITSEQLRVALAEPLVLQKFTGGFAAPHVVEMLRTEPSAGTVRTTLDAALQRHVEQIIATRLAALKDRHVTQAAAVVIDNATGEVLALAGSRDFFAEEGGQINGAWVPHSPGSAVKPFTYQLAFERGFTPASMLADLPVQYPTSSGVYRPENYAHRIYGPVTCRDALGNSFNISAVKLLMNLGGAEVLLTRLHSLGLTTLTESADHYGLGLTIGNAPVRLIELANAYACLARLGEWRPWSMTLGAVSEKPRRLLDRDACYLIADVLSDNQARLLTFGANSPLRLPFRAAVKTGTSQTYRDNWTLGFTPEYTVAVWAGNFDNTPMQEVTGVTGAAPIWRDILMHLHEHRPSVWYDEPAEIVRARIDPRTGKMLTAQSPPARLSREEVFIKGELPPAATRQDYDDRGRVILSSEYASWVRSRDNWLGDLVFCPTNDASEKPWRIAHPVPGTVIQLDPDLPGGGKRLLLEAEPSNAEVQWSCETLPVQHDGPQAYVILSPGRHTFIARAATGLVQRTHVIVQDDPP
ncbi:penicillin-binding protein 1C [Brevifollis gellanilyticus]|uniref:peptidoglycan glycosyltransferase n=1 Tax=Brevifollis gellanilyticus TaxID=748831 RepID=A0A512M8H4_9BACT|nr:penicillin-binding protein 1C [Brevifollis gellanilyticus]GEP43034.1 penicillin-binding protein 1A [Brevifollis gellanilyticus]